MKTRQLTRSGSDITSTNKVPTSNNIQPILINDNAGPKQTGAGRLLSIETSSTSSYTWKISAISFRDSTKRNYVDTNSVPKAFPSCLISKYCGSTDWQKNQWIGIYRESRFFHIYVVVVPHCIGSYVTLQ